MQKNTVLPPTTARVKLHTASQTNEKIEKSTKANISKYENKSKEYIRQRLNELHHEWDTERTLETTAGTFTFVGTILGATVNKRWYILPGVVGFFLLQHAVQGWCPPLPVIRKLGIRTADEINTEKQALLKMLENDH